MRHFVFFVPSLCNLQILHSWQIECWTSHVPSAPAPPCGQCCHPGQCLEWLRRMRKQFCVCLFFTQSGQRKCDKVTRRSHLYKDLGERVSGSLREKHSQGPETKSGLEEREVQLIVSQRKRGGRDGVERLGGLCEIMEPDISQDLRDQMNSSHFILSALRSHRGF